MYMDSGNAQPQPTFELPKEPGNIENAPGQGVEQLPSTELPSPSAPPQTPVITTNPASIAQPATPTNPVADNQTSAKAPTSGLPAEDADLIEKQWVTKTKQIVEQTKNDPYAQNHEISKVKAEYISKRFNKQIKLSEENQ
jgi:hypothetical protein